MVKFLQTIPLWLSMLWPWHHKKSPPIVPGDVVVEQHIHWGSDCYRNVDGMFFYLGSDNIIGVSSESCEKAYRHWVGIFPQKKAPESII